MINDYHALSGIQKVAILFSVVGESLAMSLVKGLSKTEIRKIRSTLSSMGDISFSVKKRVMEEFYFGFLSERDETKNDGPIQPFEFLAELNDEQLIALLDKEEPPVIAMILAQLEAEKKMFLRRSFTYHWMNSYGMFSWHHRFVLPKKKTHMFIHNFGRGTWCSRR